MLPIPIAAQTWTNKNQLLIIQTAHQSPGHSWLEYDITFWKDACGNWCIWLVKDGLIQFLLALTSSLLHITVILWLAPVDNIYLGKQCPTLDCTSWNRGQYLCPLRDAIFNTPANHVIETTHRSTAHSILLALFAPASPPLQREGSSEKAKMPTLFPVHNVSVAADQPCGLPCSVNLFCASFVESQETSVPVCLFSPLPPVHLVSWLWLSQF